MHLSGKWKKFPATKSKIMEGKLVRLRAPEPEDLEYLYRWENNTSIWHLSTTLLPFSRYELKKYIETGSKDIYETKQLRFMIERSEDFRPLGAIDLFDFDPFHLRAGTGILIGDPQERKKGLASEALDLLIDYCKNILLLKQLYCNILENNQESISLFLKKGFRITGEKLAWIKTPGGWKNEFFLQLVF